MYAINQNSPELAKLMLDYLAKVNAKENNKNNALNLVALFNKNHQLAKLLIEYNIDINATNKDDKTALEVAFDTLEKNKEDKNPDDYQ